MTTWISVPNHGGRVTRIAVDLIAHYTEVQPGMSLIQFVKGVESIAVPTPAAVIDRLICEAKMAG